MLRFILAGALLTLSLNSFAEERIVAKVGDSTITERDLEEALDHFMPPGAFHSKGLERRERYRKEALDGLIEEELLYREAVKRGLKVSDEVIETVVGENIKRLGSKKRFNEVLKERGLSIKAFRERIRKAQLVQALLREIEGQASYSEEELKDYYEKNRSKFRRPESIHLYHILLKVNPSLRDDEGVKEALSKELRERIDRGEDFREIAQRYSEDPYRVKAGDLGFVHRGQLNPLELEEAAFSLKEGEVAGPIKTIYGFHIIKAGERRAEEILDFPSVRERLSQELRERRFKEIKKDLITRLKKEYTVQILITLDGGTR